MGKLNRRRLRLLHKLILRTKINADLLKYSYNRWRWFWFNKEKDVTKAQAFRKLWQKNVPHKFCHNCIET